MRRVLIVAYYFPPLGGIGSVRALEFASHLPEFGWEPTVVAPKYGSYHRDPTLVFPEERIVRTRSLEISRAAKRVARPGTSETQPASVGRVLGAVQQWVRRRLYYPDGQIGWYPFALRGANRAVSTSRFDAVFSSSFPVTSHLVARNIKRRANLPWVAEFRDPWSDAMARTDTRRPRAVVLERELVQEASGVVLPSVHWETLFRGKGAARTWVITNGFEPDDFPVVRPPRRPVITHLGSLYPEIQDLSAIWAALGRLRARGMKAPGLEFVGELAPGIRAQLETHGLGDAFEVTGFLPHRSALERVASASVLLVAGAREPGAIMTGVIPAKVFEYLGSGRPIVYVGTRENEAARLLVDLPCCFVVDPADVDGAERALLQSLAEADRPVERDISRFTRRALTRQLAAALDSVS